MCIEVHLHPSSSDVGYCLCVENERIVHVSSPCLELSCIGCCLCVEKQMSIDVYLSPLQFPSVCCSLLVEKETIESKMSVHLPAHIGCPLHVKQETLVRGLLACVLLRVIALMMFDKLSQL